MRTTSNLSFTGMLLSRAAPWRSLYRAATGEVPALAVDAQRGFSGGAKLTQGLAAPATLTRAAPQVVIDSAGQGATVPADTAAFDWSTGARRLKLAPTVTNLFSYARLDHAALTASGQTLGTVGITGSSGGITAEVVATGPEHGGYLDWRISGANPGNTLYLNLSDDATIDGVAAGTASVVSADLSTVAGTIPGAVSVRLFRHCRTASNTLLSGGMQEVTPTATHARMSHDFVTPPTSTKITSSGIYLRIAKGASGVDFTLRVSRPQFELGTLVAGDPVETLGAPVSQAGDVLSLDLSALDTGAGLTLRAHFTQLVPFRTKAPLVAFEAADQSTVGLFWAAGTSSYIIREPAGTEHIIPAAGLPPADVPLDFTIDGTAATLSVAGSLLGSVALAAAITPITARLAGSATSAFGCHGMLRDVMVFEGVLS